jgi:hypothetical protein
MLLRLLLLLLLPAHVFMVMLRHAATASSQAPLSVLAASSSNLWENRNIIFNSTRSDL